MGHALDTVSIENSFRRLSGIQRTGIGCYGAHVTRWVSQHRGASHGPDFLRQPSVVRKYELLSRQHVKSFRHDQESAANCLFHYTWLVTITNACEELPVTQSSLTGFVASFLNSSTIECQPLARIL